MRYVITLAAVVMASVAWLPTASAEPAKDGDVAAIERCLNAWGEAQPFGWKTGGKIPAFTTMATNVKVLGIGGSNDDVGTTKNPQLVLVKPSVAVLTKNELRLLNPKGWYCLKANVTVLSKTVIELACGASVADSTQGVAVLGSNSEGTGSGVTVLGKTQLKRVGCSEKKG